MLSSNQSHHYNADDPTIQSISQNQDIEHTINQNYWRGKPESGLTYSKELKFINFKDEEDN